MDRCDACPGKYNCIAPNGPEDADIYGLGEAPGMDEERKGLPFCGKTGTELNEGYLPTAGLRRQKIRVGNTISCLPDTFKHRIDLKKKDHVQLAQTCFAHHAEQDILAHPRELILGMGAFANHVLTGGIDMEMQHGIPVKTAYGWVFPMYHPAMGLHEPKKMLQIRTDWVRLKKYLKGSLVIPVDQFAGCEDYKEIETPEQLDEYLDKARTLDAPLATDTETTRKREPYCISISVAAGTGRVVRASNRPVLTRLDDWLQLWSGPLLFHNWLFDGEVVEQMGLHFPFERVADTMVKVFHMGNLPQGLKALAYRELGMTMRDFDDVVLDDSRNLVMEFYREAFQIDWPVPQADMVRDTNGRWKVYKPQGFRTKLKRFFTDLAKNPEKDVFEQWQKNWEAHHQDVEWVMGREWPGKCISYVPWQKVIHYACRDADATLRLWDLIQYVMGRVQRYPQELWTDGYAA